MQAPEIVQMLRGSVLVRLIVMFFVLVALAIPLMMVQSVVSERAARRDTVVQEVSATWGGQQVFGGPVLTVPYRHVTTDNTGKSTEVVAHASFLPDQLAIRGVLQPEIRRRSLFDAVVYRARLNVSGRFLRPSTTEIRPLPSDVAWEDATLSIGVSDPRGITNRLTVRFNGRDLTVAPGADDGGLFGGAVKASIRELRGMADGAPLPFSFELAVNGSRDFAVIPAGSETTVELTSAWPHPSFTGAPLPETRTTGAEGFSATWRVPYFGRGYPTSWSSGTVDRAGMKKLVDASAFGVSLLQPGDIYQQAERAVKYAVLFVVFTFAVFFMWEMVLRKLLHPVQYLFIGFALCIFYLLLISLSEHIGFDVAYGVAAGATTALVAAYSGFGLGGVRHGIAIGVALAVLYGALYMLLRLEDYALLAGSIGLFVMLALLMFLTRRVNWYDLRLGSSSEQV